MPKIPLKLSIDLTIIGVGVFVLILSFFSGQAYLNIALDSQRKALVKFVDLEAHSLIDHLHKKSITLGQTIQSEKNIRQAIARNDIDVLNAILREHFNQFFVTAGVLKLEHLRLLSPDYELITAVSPEHSSLVDILSPPCPEFIAQAKQRSKVDRLKPISSLCAAVQQPYHSLILPIGLQPYGYLEIVTHPGHALLPLESALGLGILIKNSDETLIYKSDNWNTLNRDGYSVTAEYIPSYDGSSAVMTVLVRQRIEDFFQKLINTRMMIMCVVAILTALLFLMVRLIFKRIVLEPLKSLTRQLKEPGETEKKSVAAMTNELAELQDLYIALENMALTDRLTDLPNRHQFDRRLVKAFATAKAENCVHSLCCCDLDQFKIVNDTCGHEAGDELLRQLSDVFKKRVRGSDVVARMGGDEFGILLERCSLEKAKSIANAIREEISNFRFIWQEQVFAIGVSIGIVPISSTSSSVSDVLRAADTCMYAAKEQGRNRVHIYHENDEELAKRQLEMQRVSEISSALEHDKFFLEYQTIKPICPDDDTQPHCELLLRMKGDDGNIVYPDRFIPAAERYDLMSSIDQWVIRNAFAWFGKHPEALSTFSSIGINLSGHSLGADDFLEFVAAEFNQSGLSPKKVSFEITETAAITNIHVATQFIRESQKLGCKFSLDDFGVGMSSFTYLKNLPVNFLKIDGSFVRDIVSDPVDYEMVRHIHEIASMMGIKTIAEFVEDRQILEALQHISVDYAQGWYIAYPKPLSNLL